MPVLRPSYAHAGRTSQNRSFYHPTSPFLRTARLLRSVHNHLEITAAKVLLGGVPARDEPRFGAGATLARAVSWITLAGTAAKPRRASYCVVGVARHRWRSRAHGTKLTLPGETEAGSAGTQPCRGITRWAHRAGEGGAWGLVLCAPFRNSKASWLVSSTSSDDRPLCLENPRRQAAERKESVRVRIVLNQHATALFITPAIRTEKNDN